MCKSRWRGSRGSPQRGHSTANEAPAQQDKPANTILAYSTGGVDFSYTPNSPVETSTPGVVYCQSGLPYGTFTDDPRLGLLADNGGFTRTLAPLNDSPVLSVGTIDQSFPTLDQLGSVAWGLLAPTCSTPTPARTCEPEWLTPR